MEKHLATLYHKYTSVPKDKYSLLLETCLFKFPIQTIQVEFCLKRHLPASHSSHSAQMLTSFTYNTKHYSIHIQVKLPFTNTSAASTTQLKEYPEKIFCTDIPFILAHKKTVFNTLSLISFKIYLCVNMRCKFPGFFFHFYKTINPISFSDCCYRLISIITTDSCMPFCHENLLKVLSTLQGITGTSTDSNYDMLDYSSHFLLVLIGHILPKVVTVVSFHAGKCSSPPGHTSKFQRYFKQIYFSNVGRVAQLV